MVNLEQLRARGLRAYETGRVRMAARVVWLVLPVAVVCSIESREREACACLAALLSAVSVWLRWRDSEGLSTVSTGLLAGSVPLLAGLVAARLGLHCGAAGTRPLCVACSLVVGGGAGVFIALREVRARAGLLGWLAAGGIAALSASLGCVRFGVLGVASVALGIALGTSVTRLAASSKGPAARRPP